MEQALGISIRFDKQEIFSMPRGYFNVKSELLFLFLHVHTSGFGDRLDRGVRRSLVTAEEACGQAAQGGVGR